jgi:hypothetical protein
MGINEPGQQLLFLRSWQTCTLLFKNGQVTKAEIAALKKF